VAVVNVADEEFSMLILRDAIPLFFRSRPLLHNPVRYPDQGRREMQRELITSATYYRDRLAAENGGIRQAFVRMARGGQFPLDGLAAEILGVEPARLNPRDRIRIDAGREEELMPLLEQAAPAVGMVLGRWGA
jgi:hypothetical protein